MDESEMKMWYPETAEVESEISAAMHEMRDTAGTAGTSIYWNNETKYSRRSK